MKKKIACLVIVFLLIIGIRCSAKGKIELEADKEVVEINQNFNIQVGLDNESIAAYTIWLYYDETKLSALVNDENTHIIGNKIITTGVSETGQNTRANSLLNIEFKAKHEGNAIIYAIGEFYKENGEKFDIKYNQIEININGQEEKETSNSELNNVLQNSEEKEQENNLQNNTNLDVMRLNVEGINPEFNSQITEYYIIIDEDISNIDVSAIPENINSKVEITGNRSLKEGLNTIKILVTSQDATNKKEYKIYVTKTRNKEEANADLETLAVEYNNMVPEFESSITNYTLEVANNVENLNILAIPSNMKSNVNISGNEKINYGKNIVSIVVTAPNGITKKTYKIDVYRRNEEEEKVYNQNRQEELKETQNRLEQMSNTGEYEEVKNEKDITQHQEEVTNEKKNDTTNRWFAIIGSFLAIVIMGIVIIRIKK